MSSSINLADVKDYEWTICVQIHQHSKFFYMKHDYTDPEKWKRIKNILHDNFKLEIL